MNTDKLNSAFGEACKAITFYITKRTCVNFPSNLSGFPFNSLRNVRKSLVEGNLAEEVCYKSSRTAAQSVVPLPGLGGVGTLRTLYADTVLCIVVVVRLVAGPVGVVEDRAVLPAPLGTARSHPGPSQPHVLGVTGGGHQVLHELVVVRVDAGQAGSPVQRGAEDAGSEPGGRDSRDMVAAAAMTTPAVRTVLGGGLHITDEVANAEVTAAERCRWPCQQNGAEQNCSERHGATVYVAGLDSGVMGRLECAPKFSL